ncbi:MAG: flagellar biosynthetic protein FliQ [Bdellovibrionota bacterium]
MAIDLERTVNDALQLVVMLSAVALLPALVVGLCSSVLQAATQIQDQSLSFVPKLGAVLAAIYFFGDGVAGRYLRFVNELLASLR